MTTPIRRQYLEVKRRFPQAIVFFRLGDFYETFDDDARLVAQELEITLTSKPMGKDLRVPLAGVPQHSLEAHLKKLVSRGHKVAICEQMEDPRKAKGLVQRDVVRVVTPGTVVEESLLPSASSNYLVALVPEPTLPGPPGRAAGSLTLEGRAAGLAYVDVTTGEFAATTLAEADVPAELARLNAAEVIVPAGVDLPFAVDCPLTPLDRRYFHLDDATRVLQQHFGVASLDGFGLRGQTQAVCAAGAVIAYLLDNQKAAAGNVRDLRVYNPGAFMVLDASARRHLELFQTSRDGSRKGSLLDVIDATRTPMGSRMLQSWLGRPLLDPALINARLDRVQRFHADGLRRARVRECLAAIPDLERILGRVVAGAASPRDLAGLRRGLDAFPALVAAAAEPCDESGPLRAALAAASEAAALLAAALEDEPAPTVGEGGVIRPGFSPDLDEARALTRDARKALAVMETTERERTGIRSLRVAYNRVFGYYIEVSKANLGMVPAHYQRKQTLAGAERYVTPELKDLEERILQAREAIGDLEASLFQRVCAQLAAMSAGLRAAAATVAEIDAVSALAETAARYGYTRPEVDESSRIEVRDGRHPVVERALGEGRFVPNDCELDTEETQIVVLTGPNMAGKSTYLRQVALIVLLAQAGSFVPAASARIGVVDRIFTRIGAQDDLSRGESTFMVEMLETAAILRNATRRSLILFDEVGRGTSTYDGLAIARSVVEYLHSRPGQAAKTLFATHYHEMTALAATLPRVRNYSVAVVEQDGKVVFLHRIVPGGADRSYGIHVAELAGMPAPVLQRAREVLVSLEAAAARGGARRLAPPPQAALPLLAPPSAVEQELAALDLDALTPIQALNKLYELKARISGDPSKAEHPAAGSVEG
ncbi:MAG TPA: DNA mismatch repair protein MutS [Dehalococcoidia bacterium]|nr:DNA mismatch repair protein MutS [Dehalococcoidia bacterium]